MNSPLEGWPVIPLPEGETVIGRSSQCHVVVSEGSLSRRHARLVLQQNHVEIEDLDSRLGTFVNGSRIRRQVLELGDTVRFGNGPPYRFDGRQLVPDLSRIGMAVTFEDMGVRTDQGQWLLTAASLSIAPGEFVGILGPSGAGKSVLLEVLGTLRAYDTGNIRFDAGSDLHDSVETYRRQLGQVPQDDLICPWLSVLENVVQAAAIRLPFSMSEERLKRVQDVLEQVDLSDHREKPAAKLSGGQRKRLSVAVELLKEPRLLLLDEPTSGLDPGLQGRLMDLLRRLASRGMTVVCSTHTLDTINFFDRVVVVGRRNRVGTIAWSGPPDQLLPYFGVNRPDDLYHRLEDLDKTQAADSNRDAESRSDCVGEDPRDASSVTSTSQPMEPGTIVIPDRALNREQFALQAWTIGWRSWLGFQRDPMTVAMSALQPIVLATLVILSQHNQDRGVYVYFFLVVSALWMGMTLSVREIVRERPLYKRDRMAGLHPDAYLGGRVAALLVPLAVQVVLLYAGARLCVLLLVDESNQEILRTDLLRVSWFRAVTVLGIAALGGLLIGLMLSILAQTERAAVAMLPIAILPQFLLSRVASGYADKAWTETNVFLPITRLADCWQAGEVGLGGYLLMLGSLPLFSRPATGALDISAEHGFLILGEWLYLALVLLIHILVVYTVFRAREGIIETR